MEMLAQFPSGQQARVVVLDSHPATAQSILSALQDAIDERILARVAIGDYPAKYLAILELVKLSQRPDSPEKDRRMAALIEEFGEVDVERWQSFIERRV